MKGRPMRVGTALFGSRVAPPSPKPIQSRDEFSRIGFCGGGNMARAAHRRAYRSWHGGLPAQFREPAPGARESLARDFKVRVSADNRARN